MEIVNLVNEKKYRYYPIKKINQKIYCKKIINRFELFDSYDNALAFFEYDINKKTYKLISEAKGEVGFYEVYEKSIEGENTLIYLEKKRQLKHNSFIVHKINLDENGDSSIYEFDADDKFDEISIYFLNDNYFILFLKHTVFDFELELPVEKKLFGYDEVYLYDTSEQKRYRLLDESLIHGYNNALFKFNINNRAYLFFEEFYVDEWEKEDEYRYNKNRKRNKYYTDTLKIMDIETLIGEIKEGSNKYTFEEIDSKDHTGAIAFLNIDSKYLYYSSNDFIKSEKKLVKYNYIDKTKEYINIPKINKNNKILNEDIIYSFNENNTDIVMQYMTQDTINSKILSNNNEYSYKREYGFSKYSIDNRYLISTSKKTDNHKNNSFLFDTIEKKIEEHSGSAQVFGNTVVFF